MKFTTEQWLIIRNIIVFYQSRCICPSRTLNTKKLMRLLIELPKSLDEIMNKMVEAVIPIVLAAITGSCFKQQSAQSN